MAEDIRWIQRFRNFQKALLQLTEGVEMSNEASMSLLKEGVIQRFEFTHELAWRVMKDYLEFEGYQNITGSRTATKRAFNIGLISNGQTWMDMIESRNNTVHTYKKEILEVEFKKIVHSYHQQFLAFEKKMQSFL